jgi:peptidoglycan/LPS O-acetylase OafA/YrhL
MKSSLKNSPVAPENKVITSFRGFAALGVVLFHAFHSLPLSSTHSIAVLQTGIQQAYLGVDFFFLISGFILFYVYEQSGMKGFDKTYWRFLYLRVARIYPLHIVLLVAFVLFQLIKGGGVLPPERIISAFQHLFMVHAWVAYDLYWNYPSWTISMEFFAYLIFPVYLAFWQKCAEKTLLGLVGLVLLLFLLQKLIVIFCLVQPDLVDTYGYRGFPRIVLEFACGGLVYLISKK